MTIEFNYICPHINSNLNANFLYHRCHSYVNWYKFSLVGSMYVGYDNTQILNLLAYPFIISIKNKYLIYNVYTDYCEVGNNSLRC